VNLKDFIRAEKTNVDLGKWLKGHIPRSAFPMSLLKEKNYKFGPDYSWRLIKFVALERKCRVLIWYNEGKQIFRSRFGVEANNDMIVLCEFEYHAGEPGWHCHVTANDISQIVPGQARGDKKKWPRSPSRQEFHATKDSAVSIVAERYNFSAQGDLL
jgi:hypothetical protein